MRILVLWADENSPNLGIRALAVGTRELALSVFPGAEVELQSFGPGPSPIPFTERSVARSLVTGAKPLRRWLASFDLVLDTRSGDSFADIYGPRRVVEMNVINTLLRYEGVPVVLSPQTIGPFNTAVGRALARQVKPTLVMARDSASAQECARLALRLDVVATDVVFAIDNRMHDKATPSGSGAVGVNVSGLLWTANDHVSSSMYRSSVAAFIKDLRRAGREVVIFPHVLQSTDADHDLVAVREIAEVLRDPRVRTFVPTGLSELRAFAAQMSVIVGSRMHACLNALSVGTPALALSYSRKFAPLLADLGWDGAIDLRSYKGGAADITDAVMAAEDARDILPSVLEQARGKLALARVSLGAMSA